MWKKSVEEEGELHPLDHIGVSVDAEAHREQEMQLLDYEDEIHTLTEELKEEQLKHKGALAALAMQRQRVKELNLIVLSCAGSGQVDTKTLLELNQQNERLNKEFQAVTQENKLLESSLLSKNEQINTLRDRVDKSGKGAAPLRTEGSFLGTEGLGSPGRIFDMSSIDEKHDDLQAEVLELRSKLQEAEEELAKEQSLRTTMQKQQVSLKNEVREMQKSTDRRGSIESGDEILHVKDLLMNFLKRCPLTSEENESFLAIIYRMLNVTRLEIDQIRIARQSLDVDGGQSPKKSGASPKKGGGLFNRLKFA